MNLKEVMALIKKKKRKEQDFGAESSLSGQIKIKQHEIMISIDLHPNLALRPSPRDCSPSDFVSQ